MMKEIYKSAMKDDLGKEFQVKKHDNLIDKNGNFNERWTQKTTSRANTNINASEQEKFYEASAILVSSTVHEKDKVEDLINWMRFLAIELKKLMVKQKDLKVKEKK